MIEGEITRKTRQMIGDSSQHIAMPEKLKEAVRLANMFPDLRPKEFTVSRRKPSLAPSQLPSAFPGQKPVVMKPARPRF